MPYINALNRLANYCLGHSSSGRNHSAETKVSQVNHSSSLAENRLAAGNLSLPLNAAVKRQALAYNLIEKLRLLLSAKKNAPQSERYLPPEIWGVIVSFLNTENIKKLRCVSKTLNLIATPHISCIEVVNTAELPGALNFLQQTGPDTTMFRLAKGGWARDIPKIKTYPSLTDKNIKITLNKAESRIIKKSEDIIHRKQNVSLPVKAFQLFRVDLTQSDFILPDEAIFEENNSLSRWGNVELLEVKECRLSMTSLIKVIKAMPNLSAFGLYGCTGLNDLSMAGLSADFLGTALLKATSLAIDHLFLNEFLLRSLVFSEKLEEVHLVGSNISSQFLHLILKNKPNLKYLDISSCRLINDDDFLFLNDLNLISVRLVNSHLSDNFAHALLKRCPNLKNLEVIACTGLTSSALSEVANLKLTSLKLVRCGISDVVFNLIIKNQNILENFEIISCPGLNSFSFFVLSGLNLFSLKILRCRLSDDVFKNILKNQSNLINLEIDMSTGLSGMSISFLKNLKLKYLRINDGVFHESTSQDITKVMSELEILHINRCNGLNAKMFLDATHLKKLRILRLEVYHFPDISFEAMMQTMPELEELHFKKVFFLITKGFSNAFKLEKVKKLTLEISEISNQFLQKIIDIMPNLRELSLNKSYGFTDKALSEIKRLRKLEVLDISGCKFPQKKIRFIKEHVDKVINQN